MDQVSFWLWLSIVVPTVVSSCDSGASSTTTLVNRPVLGLSFSSDTSASLVSIVWVKVGASSAADFNSGLYARQILF